MKPWLVVGRLALFSMIGSSVIGLLAIALLQPWIGNAHNPWWDVPYSPCFLVPAFLMGLWAGGISRQSLAKHAWVVGIMWLLFLIAFDSIGYGSRRSLGLTLRQYVWYSYFGYENCINECLGRLVGTMPALASIAYSFGATIGLLRKEADSGKTVG